MAITRVWIEEGCISCGLSESNCPEVFKVETGEPSKVIEGADYSGLEEKIKIAAESCPVEVIKYDEDDDQKNAPPPINRFSGTISFSRRKMQSRNLEQVRKMSVDKPPKRPKKNPSKESRLKGMLKKRK